MKPKRKRIPQHEFAFAPGAFNLIQETSEDTERTAREREQAERGRAAAEKGQAQLFNPYGFSDLRWGYRRVHRRYVRPLMRRFGFTERRRRRPGRHKRRPHPQLRRRLTGKMPVLRHRLKAGLQTERRLQARRRQLQDRPWDIIDAVAEVGHISPASARRIQEGVRFTGAARKLFRKGGLGVDEVLDVLRRTGHLPESATEDDLLDALRAADRVRAASRRGDTPEAQTGKFFKALEAKRKVDVVPVSALSIGDRFKIKGEAFTVKDVDPDAEETTVVNGRRFGQQTLPR